jgi:hypothetical protein
VPICEQLCTTEHSGRACTLYDIPAYTRELAGPSEADRAESIGRRLDANQLYAAFTLGIAIGQFCDVDAFKDDDP